MNDGEQQLDQSMADSMVLEEQDIVSIPMTGNPDNDVSIDDFSLLMIQPPKTNKI
jgi:hypothetical protein